MTTGERNSGVLSDECEAYLLTVNMHSIADHKDDTDPADIFTSDGDLVVLQVPQDIPVYYLMRLVNASRSRTGSIHSPSTSFSSYVQDTVSDELNKSQPASRDEMNRRLWAAAQFDGFNNTGAIATMIDGGNGFLRVDYGQYKRIIDTGIDRIIEAGF